MSQGQGSVGNSGSCRVPPQSPPFGRLPAFSVPLRREAMPPLLEQQLERAARAGGRFMVIAFVVDEPPDADGNATINMVRVNGDNWAFDWLYRGLRMLEDDIRNIPVPGMRANKSGEADGAAGANVGGLAVAGDAADEEATAEMAAGGAAPVQAAGETA